MAAFKVTLHQNCHLYDLIRACQYQHLGGHIEIDTKLNKNEYILVTSSSEATIKTLLVVEKCEEYDRQSDNNSGC
jgi:hypothetical protein